MELNKNVEISIVDIQNPGKFWFRTATEQKRIGKALFEYWQNNYNNEKVYLPKINDFVLTKKSDELSVFRVERVVNENKLIVCIPKTGYKRIVKHSSVIQLNDKALADAALNTSILMGRVSDIFPIKSIINPKTFESEEKISDWTPESTRIFKNYADISCGANFEATSVNDVLFAGKLTFVVDFSQILVEASCAKPRSTSFDFEVNGLDNGHSNGSNGYTNGHINGQTNGHSNGFTNGQTDENDDELILSDEELSESNSDVRPVISSTSRVPDNNADTSKDEKHTENPTENPTAKFDKSASEEKANEEKANEANANEDVTTNEQNNKSGSGSGSISSSSTTSGSMEISVDSEKSSEDYQTFYTTFHDQEIDTTTMLYPKKTILSPITERTIEDEEETDDADEPNDDEIPAYYFDDMESEVNGEQYEYKWSPQKEKERQIDASNALKKQMIDTLLEDANMSAEIPFIIGLESNINVPLLFEDYLTALQRHKKMYAAQDLIWPHIAVGSSAILIGNTDYYPHLLYLPPIISMIRMLKCHQVWDKEKKVVIYASNCDEVKAIRKLCYSFLEDNTVYTDAEYHSLVFDENQYAKCDVFISLMSRICQNPKENLPTDASYIVLNNFESIHCEIRNEIAQAVLNSNQQLLITSRYYVNELRMIFTGIPNTFLSIESYFDAFQVSFGTKSTRSTEIIESNQKYLKLKDFIGGSRIVIVCNHEKNAQTLSNLLRQKLGITAPVNETPKKGTKVIICSDDQIINLNVRYANHIIHFDLPADFKTFSRRYSVLSSNYQANASKEPTSTILVASNQFQQNSALLLQMLYRNYDLCMTVKNEKNLNSLARNMNANAPLCIYTPFSFINLSHLTECKNRHFFKSIENPGASLFAEPKVCQIEILQVLSPAWFSIRITSYKDVGSDHWTVYNSANAYEKFNAAFQKFYEDAFDPIQQASDLNRNTLYTLRDGKKFSRCRIMVNCKGKKITKNVRVRLIDSGELRTVSTVNIGRLHESHVDFPPQSIDLCILSLIPWSKSGWTEHDTSYASTVLMGHTSGDIFGNGRYQTTIQWEIQSELVFAFNIFASNNGEKDRFDNYVGFITHKGIAASTTDGLEDLLQNAINANILTNDQWNRLKNFLL